MMAADLPRGAQLLVRLIPAGDRESIVGDLIEDADARGLRGAGRASWLMAECGSIAAGLTIQRARAWFALPPVREVVSGLAIDGRSVLRDGPAGTLLRALVFVASVATLALAVEVVVRTLMTAAGL
jgi:hypothetical protein